MLLPLSGAPPSLSCLSNYAEENKKFQATVCMCDNFPLTIDTVVSLLEMAGQSSLQ